METSTLEASISIKLDKIKKLSAFIVIDITFLQISQPKLNFNSILWQFNNQARHSGTQNVEFSSVQPVLCGGEAESPTRLLTENPPNIDAGLFFRLHRPFPVRISIFYQALTLTAHRKQLQPHRKLPSELWQRGWPSGFSYSITFFFLFLSVFAEMCCLKKNMAYSLVLLWVRVLCGWKFMSIIFMTLTCIVGHKLWG